MKTISKAFLLVAAITACTPQQDTSQHKGGHYFHIRIVGSDAKGVYTWVKSKYVQHKIGWYLHSGGDLGQELNFKKQDSIRATFPIGRLVEGEVDTVYTEPSGILTFEVSLDDLKKWGNKRYSSPNTKVNFELLVDGKTVQQIQLPTPAKDSLAVLSFDTNTLAY